MCFGVTGREVRVETAGNPTMWRRVSEDYITTECEEL
jgi:hypothetical protein